MKWIIKIEGKENQRILVLFKAINRKLEFWGQCKIKNSWENFSFESTKLQTTLEIIQEKLLSVAEQLNLRIIEYNDLAKSFALIKTIEIVDIDENNENDDVDDVYGFDPI